MSLEVAVNETGKEKRAPHAGINSADPIYKALAEQIAKAGHEDIVRVLGRGEGSNTVRFACAVAAEVLATGHRVVLAGNELSIKEPALQADTEQQTEKKRKK